MNGKIAALCALASLGCLDLSTAFQASSAAPIPRPCSLEVFESDSSSQLPSRWLMTGLGACGSAVSTDNLHAASTRASGIIPSLPRLASTTQLMVSTDAAGFSSIPVGAKPSHQPPSVRRLRVEEPNLSSSTDSLGSCLIPDGGAAKHA